MAQQISQTALLYVRHKSLNKSVFTHGHGVSDVAYTPNILIHSAAISELLMFKKFSSTRY